MSTPIPITQVLVQVEQAFQEELITDSGIKFYLDSSYKKEWTCSVIATVAALPIKVNPKFKHIFDELKVGDEIAVSYRIIADFAFQSDALRFMQVTEDNPHTREYVNAKGEWVKVYALKSPYKPFPIWIGVHQDSRGNVISGVQGDESDVERWLAQFPLGKTDIYSFNNLFSHEGQDYWKCDIDEIFAKKVKGHWVAIGDRVICKPVQERVPDERLIDAHKGHKVEMKYQDRGRVVTGGKSKGIKKDDLVSFNPRYLEKYDFSGTEYYLINEQLVNAKWN